MAYDIKNVFKKIGGDFQRIFPAPTQPFYPTPTGQPIPNMSVAPTNMSMAPEPRTLNSPAVPTSGAMVNQPQPRTFPPPPPPPPTPSPYNPPPTPSPYNAPEAPPQPEKPKIDPYTAYSMLLMKQLKDAQSGTDNSELLKHQRELQRESIRLSRGEDVSTSTPGMLGGASPSQYNQVRNAQVQASSVGLDNVQFELKKLENKRADIIQQLQFAQSAGDKAKEFESETRWQQADEDYQTSARG